MPGLVLVPGGANVTYPYWGNVFGSKVALNSINLSLLIICSILYPVIICQFAQVLLDAVIYLQEEGGVLSCDAQIVCVYESPCSIMDWLIVYVDVEMGWGDNISLRKTVL